MFKKKMSLWIGVFLILGIFTVLSFEKPGSALAQLRSTRDRTIRGRVISEYGPVENRLSSPTGREISSSPPNVWQGKSFG